MVSANLRLLTHFVLVFALPVAILSAPLTTPPSRETDESVAVPIPPEAVVGEDGEAVAQQPPAVQDTVDFIHDVQSAAEEIHALHDTGNGMGLDGDE